MDGITFIKWKIYLSNILKENVQGSYYTNSTKQFGAILN